MILFSGLMPAISYVETDREIGRFLRLNQCTSEPSFYKRLLYGLVKRHFLLYGMYELSVIHHTCERMLNSITDQHEKCSPRARYK